jgi:3-oxoadipate enol-lactonase
MPAVIINGLNIFYEEKGNPKSENVVFFLNGVMASTSSWNFQVPVFEKLGFRIILHDFRGQLRSDKPEGVYSFKQHADDTIELMNYLNIDQAHMIGTSYGGEVALKLAVDHPAQVKSISLIDSVSELDEVLKGFVYGWIDAAKAKEGERFFKLMMPTIYSDTFIRNNGEMLEKRTIAMKQIDPSYFDGQISLYKTFLEDVTMTQALHTISCPTLIICGENDILKPRKFSKIIHDEIKGSEYLIIPDCGHVTIFEKPNELNSAILGFVMKQI